MPNEPVYADDELLTKMECCNLFCRKLKISRYVYYKRYHKYI
jgi:hypothetical protein